MCDFMAASSRTSRNVPHRRLDFVSAVMLTLALCPTGTLAQESRPNILFIAVDDLRPELGCYGAGHIVSPNIDRLAQQSVRFDRAYCSVPTCGASRASLFTSLRPTPTRFVNASTSAEHDAPGITTLNAHFKNHGYHTVSLGKVFHTPEDCAAGWSEPAWVPADIPFFHRAENRKLHEERVRVGEKPDRGPAWESADLAEANYEDGAIADRALRDLRRLGQHDKPFLLAVGFKKPHLPFVAPQKYWELYDHQQITLPKNYFVPENAPPESIHSWGELRHYSGIPTAGPVSQHAAKMLIHGYYACVSFVDAQIGRLLDELQVLGIADNTIVMLWGDHGWNLGEHTLWCKHSCYEVSMRVPLLVRAPGINAGSTRGLTELIDLYPTLCDLSGLPKPGHLQGKSFVPLLRDPSRNWKRAVYGRFKAGDTVRTNRFRYSHYAGADGETNSRMMYDHQVDPNENRNIADSIDPKTISKHEKLLNDLQSNLMVQ